MHTSTILMFVLGLAVVVLFAVRFCRDSSNDLALGYDYYSKLLNTPSTGSGRTFKKPYISTWSTLGGPEHKSIVTRASSPISELPKQIATLNRRLANQQTIARWLPFLVHPYLRSAAPLRMPRI